MHKKSINFEDFDLTSAETVGLSNYSLEVVVIAVFPVAKKSSRASV